MKLFLGILLGLILAVGIAAGAAYMAFGDLGEFGDRDKSKDITKTYELLDFDEIDVAGVYEVNVTVGGDWTIKLSGAPEEMERVEVSVEGQALSLDQNRPNSGKRRFRNQGMTAEITMPALRRIDISGVADVEVDGVDSGEFSVRLSGVGEVDVDGTCGTLTARVSGVGELDAENLECEIVDVSVSGIGEANVYASSAVDANVSGIGSITVYGQPEDVRKDKGLLSEITIK